MHIPGGPPQAADSTCTEQTELPAWSSPSEPTGVPHYFGRLFPISKSSIFIEVSTLLEDLDFDSFALSLTDKVALSEFEQSSCSALPDRVAVATFSDREGLG